MPTDRRLSLQGSELGHLIRDARRALGKTQQQVSDEAGIAQSTWASLEAGTRAVSEKTLRNVLNAVDIPFPPDPGLVAGDDNEVPRGICVNPRCFANQILCMDGTYRFLPSLQPARGEVCPHCGKPLLTACPNSECKRAIPRRISPFCEHCGAPWTTLPETDGKLAGLVNEIALREEYLEALKSANAVFMDKSVPE